MGCADIIPGVSGSTIALVLGIYQKFIHSLSWIGSGFLQDLLNLNFKKIIRSNELKFLINLFLGIVLAILIMSRIIGFALTHYTFSAWGAFFIFITYSLFLILKEYFIIKRLDLWLLLIVGTGTSFFITNQLNTQLPNEMSSYFLGGLIGICTMLIPGISGSYVLLLLGMYERIISILKNPLDSLPFIISFIFGAGLGFVLFSRILRWLIESYEKQLISLMAGIILGSLVSLFPWSKAEPTILGYIVMIACLILCVLSYFYRLRKWDGH